MKVIIACLIALVSFAAKASDEISLYDGRGRAVAYIVNDRDLTIFLWSGEPVAYLVRDVGRDFHVYGFNGKHLGWLVDGIVRDEEGNATCALKSAITTLQPESLKSLKSLAPLKSLGELAPIRPLFSLQWSELPCKYFMAQGK